jgi:predicted TIM-barrel fold metal-dependent hydrolase
MWQKWLPKKYLDRAPQLVSDGQGGDAWQLEPGRAPDPIGLTVITGQGYDKINWYGYSFKNISPACYDGKERLKALDFDGVDAEVIYPPQRTMGFFIRHKDPEYQMAGIQAFNRWVKEDFCAADPSRLKAVYQIPNVGVETAVTELKRAKQLGYAAVGITAWPSGNPVPGPEDDAFWAAAEEAKMPIGIHITLAGYETARSAARSYSRMTGLATGFAAMPTIIIDLIFSGVFDRHPGLQIICVEAGCGWVPYFMEQMDDRYWRDRTWSKLRLNRVPSEYVPEHFYFCVVRDFFGIRVRHEIGLDRIIWATDFPHHINDYPYSKRVMNEMFGGVPAEERQKMVCETSAKLFGFVR